MSVSVEHHSNVSPFNLWLNLSQQESINKTEYNDLACRISDLAKEIPTLLKQNQKETFHRITTTSLTYLGDPSFREQMGRILYNRTLTSDKVENVFSQAVESVRKELSECKDSQAQECVSLIDEMQNHPYKNIRPQLPMEIVRLIYYKIPLKEWRDTGVSIADRTQVIYFMIEIINQKQISFFEFGFRTLNEVITFFGDCTKRLTYLDLTKLNLEGLENKKLKMTFPNATHLSIKYNPSIKPECLLAFEGISLTYVNFSECEDLADIRTFELLQKMPITHLIFQNCNLVKGEEAELHSLNMKSFLKDMPLTHLDFSRCVLLDDFLENFEGKKLTNVDFSRCYQLTNCALKCLQGREITLLNFSGCIEITNEGLEKLEGMPLTYVNFNGCMRLTIDALKYFKGMPLKEIHFSNSLQLMDKVEAYLPGVVLERQDFTYGALSRLTLALWDREYKDIADLFNFCRNKEYFNLCEKIKELCSEKKLEDDHLLLLVEYLLEVILNEETWSINALQGLFKTLKTCLRIPISNHESFEYYVQKIILSLPGLYSTTIVEIAQTFANLNFNHVELFTELANQAILKSACFDEEGIVMLVGAFNKLGIDNKLLFTELAGELDINNTFKSDLIKLRFDIFKMPKDPFYDYVAERFILKMEELGEPQIAILANEFANLNINNSKLFEKIAQVICRKLNLSEGDMIAIGNAFTKFNIRHKGLFDHFGNLVIKKEHLSSGFIFQLTYVFSTFNIRNDRLFDHLAKIAKQNFEVESPIYHPVQQSMNDRLLAHLAERED